MSIFDEVQQLASDYDTLWGVFRQSEAALKDLTAAAGERIEAEKAAERERVDRLTRQSVDPARPEVIRRLAAAELERAKDKPPYRPTQAERNAFEAEMEQAQEAVQESYKLHKKLHEELTTAKRTLEKIRADSIGSNGKDFSIADKWLEERQREFDRLEG